MGVMIFEFQQFVIYKCVIEGEFVVMIFLIEGVMVVLVQFVIFEESVFVFEIVDVIVLVFVEILGSLILLVKQVEVIVYLILVVVSGMKFENVVVVDQSGWILFVVGVGFIGGIDQQVGDYEVCVIVSVQQLFDIVVGVGNVIVIVVVDIDCLVNECVEEIYMFVEGVLLLLEQICSEIQNGLSLNVGVFGFDNIVVFLVDGDGMFELIEELKINVVNKSMQSILIFVGLVLCQLVLVVVDVEVVGNFSIVQLSDLVEMVVGIDVDCGDVIMVEFVNFSQIDIEVVQVVFQVVKDVEVVECQVVLLNMIIIVVVIVIFLLVVFIVFIFCVWCCSSFDSEFDQLFGECLFVILMFSVGVLMVVIDQVLMILFVFLEMIFDLELEFDLEFVQVSFECCCVEIDLFIWQDLKWIVELLWIFIDDRQLV